MEKHPSIIFAALMALVATAQGQNPVPPSAPAPAVQAKSDAASEMKAVSAPYHAAVETVSAEYQKWIVALDTWYLAELDKLQAARAKLGDLDGAVAIKAERARMASHSPTTPEQIQAMPAPLRTLRAGYDQAFKKSADEGARRIDTARRKYLADLEALQKRITISGDIDQALLVKAEKERFLAELTAGPGTAVSTPPPPPPVIPVPVIVPAPPPKTGFVPIGPASAIPLAATKARPFVNTLGLEFVPVTGTKVLFCRWQTRVKDYAEFAKTRNLVPLWKLMHQEDVPIGREPEHPVTTMTWVEAKEFCEWLTKKEIAAGKLPKGMEYRLPTDEEWSRAVGLPKEEGATPKDRSAKNQVDFPWGTEWPPKAKVGNYGDETFHARFPNERQKWIEGYTDGFLTTAPVGSFPANEFGLHDLGSNVYEWCEDWYDAGQTVRVTRGTSWANGNRFLLLSSHRSSSGTPDSRSPNVGFRCVLGMSAQ